mmetsp:Transcript_14555/g.24220  ORF Transcript_14555/g.24220 Transcript_14555/m.24220 type:complete len:243 (+) Transcript_14555:65-793(+)|eukprot:CAMPEP_0119312266 /NCGR_PEP_ID=MMETSP1333-20130426/25695_1 /TAXON_ID=418940 /ORGANISM="Scyphosphaera apsteinii, Strain RCC1455" /LENGTH=242 /DNA_ID=CAMNT_0007316863 /DNA_START=65 /DNA_END=793 /DNA_ORIENTATION=-
MASKNGERGKPFNILQLRDDWRQAAQRLQGGIRALVGSHLRPWREFAADFSMPTSLDRPQLFSRMMTNLLHFRTNYSVCCICWSVVCAIRKPFALLCLAVPALACFHALVVRRGVIHLPLHNGCVVTLMNQRLMVVLAAGCSALLLLFGVVSFLLVLVTIPALGVLLHALCVTTTSLTKSDLSSSTAELLHTLHAAFHDKEAETAELEGGMAEPILRDPDMARKVEQIRQKYRPPAKKVSQD